MNEEEPAAKEPLYQTLDELSAAWAELEAEVRGVMVKSPDVPLSVERPEGSGKVRLCYNGRPVLDCKAQEKVEAAGHLPAFFALVRGAKARLRGDAAEAVLTVRRHVPNFRHLKEQQ